MGRKRKTIIAALVIIAVLATATIIALKGRSQIESADSLESAETAEVGPNGDHLAFPSGVRIDVPAGAVDTVGRMTVTTVLQATEAGPAVTRASSIADIHLDGATLKSAITIRIPITDPGYPIPSDETGWNDFVVGHWVSGQWQALPTTVDGTQQLASATTTSLSPFGVFRPAIDFVKDLATASVEKITGGVATFVPEPRCDGHSVASSWTATPANNPLSWCAALTSAGTTNIQVANRRRYAVAVSVSAGGSIGARSTNFAAQVSSLTSRPNTVVLAPGEVADIKFGTQSEVASRTISVEYDGLAQSITSLVVAADILAELTTRVPWAKTRSGKDFLASVNAAKCLKSVGIDIDATAVNPAPLITKLVGDCFASASGVVGTILGGAIATIAGVVGYFVSSGSALFDLIVGGARGSLTEGPRRPSSTTPSTQPAHRVEPELQGDWSGMISSSDPTVSPFRVDIALGTETGTIRIDASGCVGTLEPVSMSGGILSLAGSWSSGSCLDGDWQLQSLDPTTAHYAWTQPGTGRVDQGDVEKNEPVDSILSDTTAQFLSAWQAKDASQMRQFVDPSAVARPGRTIPDDLLSFTPNEDAFECDDTPSAAQVGCYISVTELPTSLYMTWVHSGDQWLVKSFAPDA